MIVLDTHAWIWWVDGDGRLTLARARSSSRHEEGAESESVRLSCWGVAKLVELGRLALSCSLEEWLDQALSYPGVQLIALTPEIAMGSTGYRRLPP